VAFQKVGRYRLYEAVLEQLLNFVKSGDIKVGERFPSERELERELGVSRGILREAFRILEARGIIESRQGGGRFLRQTPVQSLFDSADIFTSLERAVLLDICESRQVIEVKVAELAAERATDEDLANLTEVVDTFFTTQFDPNRKDDLDLDFHLAIAECTHNFALQELVRVLMSLLKQHRQQAMLDPAEWQALCLEHRKILEAIAARDGKSASRVMHEHLESLRMALSQAGDGRG